MTVAPEGEERVITYTLKELLAEIRTEMVGVREDVRDRFHKLSGAIEGLDKRLSFTEAKVEDLEQVRAKREPQLDSLLENKTVQNAVITALTEAKDKGFSRKEKMLTMAVGVVLLLLNMIPLLHIHVH